MWMSEEYPLWGVLVFGHRPIESVGALIVDLIRGACPAIHLVLFEQYLYNALLTTAVSLGLSYCWNSFGHPFAEVIDCSFVPR